MPEHAPIDSLDPRDLELIDRVALKVVEYHAELPAVLALESGRPLSLVAGQTLVFFEPLVGAFLRLPDYRRFASLIERREAVEALIRAIETRADEAHAARAEARRAARAAKPPHTVRPPRT